MTKFDRHGGTPNTARIKHSARMLFFAYSGTPRTAHKQHLARVGGRPKHTNTAKHTESLNNPSLTIAFPDSFFNVMVSYYRVFGVLGVIWCVYPYKH